VCRVAKGEHARAEQNIGEDPAEQPGGRGQHEESWLCVHDLLADVAAGCHCWLTQDVGWVEARDPRAKLLACSFRHAELGSGLGDGPVADRH